MTSANQAQAASTFATASLREKYNELAEVLKEISYLNGAAGVLEWDQNVMMPPGASAVRAKQMSALSGLIHEKSTSKTLGSILNELNTRIPKEKHDFNEYELANIRIAEHDYSKVTRVPSELVKAKAELQGKGYDVWVNAREKSDWKIFEPIMEEWVRICKEYAKCINPDISPYDVHLDDYERGLTSERLDELFSDLKRDLIPLIHRIKSSENQPDASFLKGTFSVEKQAAFSHAIAKQLGFNTDVGRLDVSVHPFTQSSHPTDVRMTTRYIETKPMEGITGTIHETGHSLYEQGRNIEYADLPVSQALSFGIHESQSLLWERMVGLSRPFWQYFLPKLQSQFPDNITDSITTEQFYRAINISEPGFIRVGSDEVTYPMHIILRYEIERDLLNSKMEVKDVPKVWNAKMKEYLGLDVPNNKVGVLQDMHWAASLWGYFPTYVLGSIYAVQFWQTIKQALPTLDQDIAQGNFAPLRLWLNENIHRVGSVYRSGDELVKHVTGSPLDARIFTRYVTEKYTDIYKL
ncbi:uncharacterized protein VTP21DRAFT_6620 [Calcarisporiella thermophila]|uniref:uncharacterized protein n=1 Tax=Calcarisporiella thermophila TaxID=911321 RepID=UPI003743C9A4